MGRRSLVKKNNTGGGRGCFGRRPTWDRKQRWMGDKCDENPAVTTPRGLKYSAGHNHDDDLGSVVLVGVVGVSNASSLGRLSLVKSSFDHDLGKRSAWGLGWFRCPSSNPGNAIVVPLRTFGWCTVQMWIKTMDANWPLFAAAGVAHDSGGLGGD